MLRLSNSQRARLRWIFRGPNGIRAGWSALIFIAILAVPIVPVHILVVHYHLMPKGELPLGLFFINEILTLAVILAATFIMGRIENRSFMSYGLAGRHVLTNFLAGCLGGFACLSLLVGILYARGNLVFDGLALHGGLPIIGYGLLWLFGFVLVGLTEETMFRGYLQYTLARGMRFWPASLLLSVLFAAAHIQNKGENILGLLQVVAAGLVLCLLLRVTGSLWMSIGFHNAWDWAQSYLYSTPDSGLTMQHHLFISHAAGDIRFSGGTVGPEGSVLATPLLILGPLLLAWICQRAGLFGKANELAVPAPDSLPAPFNNL